MRKLLEYGTGTWLSVLTLLILAACSPDKQEEAESEAALPAAEENQTVSDANQDYEMVVKDAEPVMVRYEPAPYPPHARPDSAQGMVEIRCKVLTDGTVGEKIILKRVHPLCDATALSSASRCHFIPARKDGEFVEAWVTLKFPFKFR